MKANIFVRGDVQGVGFRSYARRAAMQLGLKGLVRNVPGGSVELFVDGAEEAITQLVSAFNTRKREGFYGMHVEQVKVVKETDRAFKPTWRNYQVFEIDY